jgi:hypothetical protein
MRDKLVLVALSALFVAILVALKLPAAVLLGAMCGAIAFAAIGYRAQIPSWASQVTQVVIGLMISRVLTVSTLTMLSRHLPMFVTVTTAVIGASVLLGWGLKELRIFPGSTALWGASPGAATAMVLLAEANGADSRLVAIMQYTRVLVVASVASAAARLVGVSSAAVPAFFPPVHLNSLALIVLLIGACLVLSHVTKMKANALLFGMVVGAPFNLDLPPLLLAASYTVIGWSIGLKFTRELLKYALRALPWVVGANLTLVLICLGFAYVLTRVAGVDLLTAYLATSPGGADSVAIIASRTKVDMPFVIALQTARFLLVLVGAQVLKRKFGP